MMIELNICVPNSVMNRILHILRLPVEPAVPSRADRQYSLHDSYHEKCYVWQLDPFYQFGDKSGSSKCRQKGSRKVWLCAGCGGRRAVVSVGWWWVGGAWGQANTTGPIFPFFIQALPVKYKTSTMVKQEDSNCFCTGVACSSSVAM